MESPPLPVLGLDTTDSNALAKLLQQACETFADPIFVKNRQHQWIAGNKAFFDLFGLPSSAVLGKSDPDFFPPEQVEVFWAADDALFSSGESSSNKENLTSQGRTGTHHLDPQVSHLQPERADRRTQRHHHRCHRPTRAAGKSPLD
jgi:PAS domain S-box-containing protein